VKSTLLVALHLVKVQVLVCLVAKATLPVAIVKVQVPLRLVAKVTLLVTLASRLPDYKKGIACDLALC
jgi:hypothetical protein